MTFSKSNQVLAECAYCMESTARRELEVHHCTSCFAKTQGGACLMITTLPVMPYCLYIPHVIINPGALSRSHSKCNVFEVQRVASFSGNTLIYSVCITENYKWLILSANQLIDIGKLWALCLKKVSLATLPKILYSPALILMTVKLFCFHKEHYPTPKPPGK